MQTAYSLPKNILIRFCIKECKALGTVLKIILANRNIAKSGPENISSKMNILLHVEKESYLLKNTFHLLTKFLSLCNCIEQRLLGVMAF